MKALQLILTAACLPLAGVAHADISSNLVAYYNFDAAGTGGIANQIDGGSSHNGSYGSGTVFGVTPSIAGTGAGFVGNAAFEGSVATTTTDRSALLVGNALNISKSDASATAGSGWFNVPTLNAATLGSNFTISAWFFLAPDADNIGTDANILRDYVFEGSTNFDVSFGTNDNNGTTFVSWVGETSGAQNAGTLATGQWHHVAHVFSQSGANTAMAVYINGLKVGPTVSTPTANMNFTALNFGAARNGTRVFDGMLDEVAVWNRTLTPNEITEVFQRGQASLALTADLAAAGKAFVSVVSSNPVMGQTFGTGLYDLNTSVEIEGFPTNGHVFTTWDAPFEAEPSLFFHTVTSSITITANFAQDTADPDSDGLTNYQELVVYLTDPNLEDTDGDLIHDGDEVLETLTNPNVSQLAAVNWIQANLGGGGTNPGDIVLTRNPTNNTLTFKMGASESTTLGGWSPVSPAAPGVSAGIGGGSIQLEIPGTTDTKRFFRMSGEAP